MSDCCRGGRNVYQRPGETDYDQSGVMRGKIVMKEPCNDIPIVISRYERADDGELLRREVDHFEADGEVFEKPEKRPYQEKDYQWLCD